MANGNGLEKFNPWLPQVPFGSATTDWDWPSATGHDSAGLGCFRASSPL